MILCTSIYPLPCFRRNPRCTVTCSSCVLLWSLSSAFLLTLTTFVYTQATYNILHLVKFSQYSVSLWDDSYWKGWSLLQRHTSEDWLWMCGSRPTFFWGWTVLLPETVDDAASSILMQFGTCWLFLASQATRLPLVGPALRCPIQCVCKYWFRGGTMLLNSFNVTLWGPCRHSWSHCRTPEGMWAWVSTNALNCLEWDSSWEPDF